jgi:hypothetical protein
MADNWVAPTVPPAFNVGTTLLLTDGTLFAQDSFTANWWRLRPDSRGDYAKGRWAKAAAARQARRGFAAAVLPDGRVFVAGGTSAELYDPAIDRWTDLPAPAGWAEIGNPSCRVLADGTVLMAHANTGECAIYDAEAGAWRPTGKKRNPGAGSESWTVLRDGSVLAVSHAGNLGAERYIGGAWREEGTPPDAFTRELSTPQPSTPPGPAILLPDGSVFAAGATGATAIFTPDADPARGGVWGSGPSLPLRDGQPLSAAAGPGCLLPDGSALFVAAATDDASGRYLGGRSILLTYGGAAVAECAVQPPMADTPPGSTRLLLLPNGQVLFTIGRANLQFLMPTDAAGAARGRRIAQAPRPRLEERSPLTPPARDTGARDTGRDDIVQEEMFWRDLNEVHLLMDFISGRNDKSLLDLKDIPDLTPGAKEPLTAREALHRICLIRFPPVGSPDDKADQAALLLFVKDRLNAMAFPARGLSVAFTSLFAAINIGEDRIAPNRKCGTAPGAVHSGTGFALAAYPNLEYRAAIFRRFFRRLPIVTIIWLIITTSISWDVVICAQTLHKMSAETAAFPGPSINDTTCDITRGQAGLQAGLAQSDSVTADVTARCRTLVAVESGAELVPPGAYAARQSAAALFVGRPSWYHPVGLVVRLLDPTPKRSAMASLNDAATPPYLCGYMTSCRYDADVADFAESVVNVFSNNILPMLFGVLGTLAGLMRSITAKVRENTLNPRDHRLSWSLIPLGAVAGLTVGLIITPNAGTVGFTTISSLSATALSFLAGYGAEGFFTMLDGVLARIFPPTPPSGPAPGR